MLLAWETGAFTNVETVVWGGGGEVVAGCVEGSRSSKILHFLCRACKGSLGVKKRLCWRHVSETSSCSICGEPSKSILHALFSCKYAKAIWQMSSFNTLIANLPSSSFSEAFSWLMNTCTKDEMRTICALMWAAWFCRNKHIFENEALDAPMVATGFVRLVDAYGLNADRVFRW